MLQLVIGNANYSSWSMRGWLLLRLAELDFDLIVVSQKDDGWQSRVRELGGQTGRVPVMILDEHPVWDSIAIAEYCHEKCERIWPGDIKDRARARSLAAEMHAGFGAIRTSMPCNFRARDRLPSMCAQVTGQVSRIAEIWSSSGGGFLFGQ